MLVTPYGACKKQASLIANMAFAPLIFSRYITACKKQASQTTEHGSAEGDTNLCLGTSSGP